MRIVFTHSRSHAYFRALLRKAEKSALRRSLVTAAVLAACGALAVWVSQGEGAGTVIGVVVLVSAAVVPLRVRRVFAAAAAVPASWTGPRTWVITDDGLESSTELTSSRWSWDAVRRVDALPEAYVLWQDGPANFDVPRQPMNTDQDAQLRTFLAGRGLLNPPG